jgi:hypothetical protein
VAIDAIDEIAPVFSADDQLDLILAAREGHGERGL